MSILVSVRHFCVYGVCGGILLVSMSAVGVGIGAAERSLETAVADGLSQLVQLQADDGSFNGGTGMTALAGMALLAGGHTPTRGVYKDASAKCLASLLRSQDTVTGYLAAGGSGRMYAHGFATLYLAECYGMTPNTRVRRALEAALALIYRSQNDQGGWRYDPVPLAADLSVTVCQINAIRAAYNVGVGGDASQQHIGRALEYVRGCHNGNGSFSYRLGTGGNGGARGGEGVPRAAAGAMSLIGAGINSDTDSVLGPALKFLRRHNKEHIQGDSHYFWYGQYYAAQAFFHSRDRADWDAYWLLARPRIMHLQNEDGSWNKPDGQGAAYNTAMALIILQIPNNYLPIFQR